MAVQSAYRDAERTNNSPRSAKIYKDLNLNFGRHPMTKEIQTLTDAAAVKRSVRNLVQMGEYEKPFHPEIASGVRDVLFENITPFSAQTLSRKIEDVITNFEPRVGNVQIEASSQPDDNTFSVKVIFDIVGLAAPTQTFSFLLEPTR